MTVWGFSYRLRSPDLGLGLSKEHGNGLEYLIIVSVVPYDARATYTRNMSHIMCRMYNLGADLTIPIYLSAYSIHDTC